MTAKLWSLEAVQVPGVPRPRLECFRADIPTGVTAVLGASGAGKTTLLNLLVGALHPTAGRLTRHFDTRAAVPCFWGPPDDGLWPHLTAAEHLRTVLPLPVATHAHTAGELLHAFDLQLQAAAYPATLSRGERNRLAVARAVASRAAVLVLDEPLSHVSAAHQRQGWAALRRSLQEHAQSLVFATHQPDVVLREADWCLVLHGGRLLAAGPPQELYRRPPDAITASLLGAGTWIGREEAACWLPDRAPAECCLRPEHVQIVPAPEGNGVVQASLSMGPLTEVELQHVTTFSTLTVTQLAQSPPLTAGQRVKLTWLAMWMLACLACVGCTGAAAGPQLPIAVEHHWTVVPEGVKIPAPRAITAVPDGTVYVLDNVGRVLAYNPDGELLRSWWMPEYVVGRPERILETRDGRLVVADTHYHRVVVFDRVGTVLNIFGTEGEGPGEFIYPVAVAEDDRERLYVCEYGGNDRVQVFDRDGHYLSEFGTFGTGVGQFQRPSGILWLDGRLYIADAFNNRIYVCDTDGRPIEFAEPRFAADLHYPYDIAVGPAGDFFVVEYGAGRVTRFDADGRLLGRSGRTGTGAGELFTPWGLSVDTQGRVLVADTGNRRIVQWTFAR